MSKFTTVKSHENEIYVRHNFEHTYPELLVARSLKYARNFAKQECTDWEENTGMFDALTSVAITYLLEASSKWFTDGSDRDDEEARVEGVIEVLTASK
jgi:hypothetical protein